MLLISELRNLVIVTLRVKLAQTLGKYYGVTVTVIVFDFTSALSNSFGACHITCTEIAPAATCR
jgi:hypothetical protein